MEHTTNALLKIEDLTFFYPEETVPALSGVSLDIFRGELIVVCGTSGSGKSTLLRHLKTTMTPHGHSTGQIDFRGVPLFEYTKSEQAKSIGFVQQSVENQIVTERVWQELAFGLESLGHDTQTIRRRVAEISTFFGLQTSFHKEVHTLSGGQKQLLNLASVMAMQPDLLILDEPTRGLDPMAATEFIGMLGKINREFGTTIFMTEHRLDEVVPLANRVAVMESGRMLVCDAPKSVATYLQKNNHAMCQAMPVPMRVWGGVASELPCPLTIGEGREWLMAFIKEMPNPNIEFVKSEIEKSKNQKSKIEKSEIEPVVELSNVWFRYEKNGDDIIKGLSLQINQGEFLSVLGGNGTGKTTVLKLIAGLQKSYRGTVHTQGAIAVLPQNPETLFLTKSVREEVFETWNATTLSADETAYIMKLCEKCRITHLFDRHPYDLSGGERQRVALCKVLRQKPDILLLDEPTNGLDAELKFVLADILKSLLQGGIAICMVSHDVEFCANVTDRCALIFDGDIITDDTPHRFFCGNQFFTTGANRMGRECFPDVLTVEELLLLCGAEAEIVAETEIENATKTVAEVETITATVAVDSLQQKQSTRKQSKKGLAIVSFFLAVVSMVRIVRTQDLSSLMDWQGISAFGKRQLFDGLFFVAMLILFLLATHETSPSSTIAMPIEKVKLRKRTQCMCALILLSMPLTLYFGIAYFSGMRYYLIAFLLVVQAMLPFFIVFEDRKPQARELAIIATLCAIAIVGRMAFFMLPQFKPVMAIAIVSGIVFGGEVGFFVGAMSMLVSNVLFSQGPWTPFQMFAMGIVGFLSCIVFQKGRWVRTKLRISIFGAVSAMVIYGGIMNVTHALLYGNELSLEVILIYVISGLPIDMVHAMGTFLFLWFGCEPMIEKLERIRVKYGFF